jgi:hypothetical protein
MEDLEAAAARGSSAGIPLHYPWANRLAEPRYRSIALTSIAHHFYIAGRHKMLASNKSQ